MLLCRAITGSIDINSTNDCCVDECTGNVAVETMF